MVPADRRPVLVDTDPGIDDAMAILMLLASPEVRVVALTSVFGNAATGVTTHNAKALLALADADIPVHRGAHGPLVGAFHGGAPHVHGVDGMGDGNAFPDFREGPDADLGAPAAIIAAARAAPGALTILALGPLTNLALALLLDPDIDTKVGQVVLMGGNPFVPGNATPAAEANIWADPEAADRVLGARWPLTLVGLDVTHGVNLSRAALARIAEAQTPGGHIVRTALPFYTAFTERTVGIEGIYAHDPTAAAFLLDAEAFGRKHLPVRVATDGVGRGKTFPGPLLNAPPPPAWENRPDIAVCTHVDGARVLALIEARLTGG